jgi:hypothetical protein
MMFLPSYKARLQWAGLFVPALTALSAGAACGRHAPLAGCDGGRRV